MKRLLALILLVPALAACESMSNKWDSITGSDSAVSKAPACPPVVLPSELAAYGKDASPMDMKAAAQLKLGEVSCDHGKDGLEQHVELTLTATKGPALKEGKVAVPFFAAVVTPSGDLLAKKLYRTTFDFDDDSEAKEELALTFTLTPAQAEGNSIYIGFSGAAN